MSIVQRLLDTAQMRTQYPEWMCAEMEAAAEEIMRLRKDAERYRWLIENCSSNGGMGVEIFIGDEAPDAADLGAAIDKAMIVERGRPCGCIASILGGDHEPDCSDRR